VQFASNPPPPSQPFDAEACLVDLEHRTQALVLVIQEALARLRNTSFRVPGETDDHTAYRRDGQMGATLSDQGEQVMLALLKLGLTDEQVSVRMSVSPAGVAARRRKWGRSYGQKG
jgi:hypothetical protein